MKWLVALALCTGCHMLFGLDDLNPPPPDSSAVDAGIRARVSARRF